MKRLLLALHYEDRWRPDPSNSRMQFMSEKEKAMSFEYLQMGMH